MATFHMHGICPHCSGKLTGAGTIYSTISLTHAERVPDGPTDLFPCPLCSKDVIYDIAPGEADMPDDVNEEDDRCFACGWRPNRASAGT